MKKSTKIGMSFLFILLFTSMISTTVYLYYMGDKEVTKAEKTEKAEETSQNCRLPPLHPASCTKYVFPEQT